jgi:hypothetical protein
MELDPLALIKALNKGSRYIETIFMQGGCFRFHKVLFALWPNATPYINRAKDHVITRIDGQYYDVTGYVDSTGFAPLVAEDVPLTKSWSFEKQAWLSLGECPQCEEPLLISPTEPVEESE